MRLIDADALKSLILRRRKEAKTLTGIDMVMVTDDQPTIEAVPLDKLCDWLAEKAVFFADDNDSDPEAWKETIKECVMEGKRENDL